MKKILIVTGSLHTGGLERVAINCVKHADCKCSFDFLTLGDKKGDLEEEVITLGGRVFSMPLSSNPLKQFLKVYGFLRSNGTYDVIHSHLFFNSGIILMAAFLVGIKVRIAHVHSIKRKNTSVTKEFFYNFLRILLRLFTTIPCACSSKAGNYVFGKNFFQKKGIIVPNILDIDKFVYNINERQKVRNEFFISHDSIVFGQIGRLSEEKNQKLLLKIFSKLIEHYPFSKLIIVGDGDLRKELIDYANQLNITESVIFTGTRKDTPSLLSSMDVFICSSTNEGLGIVLLEAQANSLPCVACKFAIVDEVKLLGNCELVNDYYNIEEWINACENALIKGRNTDVVNTLKDSIFTVDNLRQVMLKLY